MLVHHALYLLSRGFILYMLLSFANRPCSIYLLLYIEHQVDLSYASYYRYAPPYLTIERERTGWYLCE